MIVDDKEKKFIADIGRCLVALCFVEKAHNRDDRRSGIAEKCATSDIFKISKEWKNFQLVSNTMKRERFVQILNELIGGPGSISKMDVCEGVSQIKILPILLRNIVELKIDGCYETMVLKLKNYSLNDVNKKYFNELSVALEVSKLRKDFVTEENIKNSISSIL